MIISYGPLLVPVIVILQTKSCLIPTNLVLLLAFYDLILYANNFELFSSYRSYDDGSCRILDARHSQFSPRIYIPKPPEPQAGQLQMLCRLITTHLFIIYDLPRSKFLTIWKSNGPSSSSIVPQSHQISCKGILLKMPFDLH